MVAFPRYNYSMKSVLIVQPKIPEYRIPFFQALQSKGLETGVFYRILSAEPTPNLPFGNQNSTEALPLFFSTKSRKLTLGDREILFQTIPFGFRNSDLIIAEHAIRNVMTYKWAFFSRPKKFALWGHGKTYTKRKSRFEEFVKNRLVLRSDWFFGYTPQGVEEVVGKGFSRDQTTIVFNSTDTERLNLLISQTSTSEIEVFRKMHELHDGPTCVFIGTFEESKRLDFLLESLISIHNQIPKFQMLFFGEGPQIDLILSAVRQYPYIKYLGKAKEETKALVAGFADCILMPGRVGLIAVDSLTLGLPIVTTNWPWHAPEFEYLSHRRNAIIAEDKLAEYSKAVCDLLNDSAELESLRKNCYLDSTEFGIEKMATNFHLGVNSILR